MHVFIHFAFYNFQAPIVVCIPYKAPKQVPGHTSKEAVVKIEKEGQWACLETREETFDNYKVHKIRFMP